MRKEILKKAEEIIDSEVYGEEDVPDEVVIGIMSEFPDAGEVEFLDRGRYSDWGSDAGSFTVDGEEFNWIISEEEAERIAVEYVRQDLEESPEMFTEGWLLGHMDEDRIINELRGDITNWVYDEPESYTSFINNEEPEEEGSYSEDQIERMAEGYLEDIRQDPVDWFKGVGYEGADLMSHLHIDIDSAAEDAVATDGWAHFLSHYDGNYAVTENGVVYFKE